MYKRLELNMYEADEILSMQTSGVKRRCSQAVELVDKCLVSDLRIRDDDVQGR